VDEEPRTPPRPDPADDHDVDQDEVDAVERGEAEPASRTEEVERAAEREDKAAEG
jgi:hypothetical protein